MNYRYELSEAQLDAVFAARIAPLTRMRLEPASEPPSLVLLGGQPGAGKTQASHLLTTDARFTNGARMFVPEGDKFRAFHPDYERAHREDPILMPDITSQASGQWLRRSIDLGFQERSSMLIEGTWRDEKVPLSTLARAVDEGYRVHAVVVAVPPEVSRLDTLGRYYDLVVSGESARWTPPAAHDEAVAKLSATLEALASHPDVATFSVVTRDGTCALNQEPPSPQRATRAVKALEEAREAYWTPEARAAWLDAVDDRYDLHMRYTRTDPDAVAVWERILTQDCRAPGLSNG